MEKYCKIGQVIDDNIIRPMRCARWIAKATRTHIDTHTYRHTHSLTHSLPHSYVLLIHFSLQRWFTHTPQRKVYTYILCFFLHILLTVHPNIMIVIFSNLMQKFFIVIHLLYSSTCFEHYYAHLQEDKLYFYSIWYRHSL